MEFNDHHQTNGIGGESFKSKMSIDYIIEQEYWKFRRIRYQI